MENNKNFGKKDPEQLEEAQDLGEREREALKIAVHGIIEHGETGEKPPPMKIKITSEKPFNMREFTSAAYQMGVDVTKTLKEARPNTLVFQPMLREKDENLILDGAIVISAGLEKYFK
ncbi:MAG: hypothetical protein AAB675_00525 [Patescibacteria group bacterium]